MGGIVTMDKSGRIVIPTKIRRKYKTNKFEMRVDEEKIELRPIKPLESLFGVLPELDIEKIRKEHEEEVNNEHF